MNKHGARAHRDDYGTRYRGVVATICTRAPYCDGRLHGPLTVVVQSINYGLEAKPSRLPAVHCDHSVNGMSRTVNSLRSPPVGRLTDYSMRISLYCVNFSDTGASDAGHIKGYLTRD